MNYKFVRNSNKGKAVMSQAVVVKVLGIGSTAYYNINEKFPWLIDIVHHGYGRINVKYSTLSGIGRGEGYKFLTDKKTVNCDTSLPPPEYPLYPLMPEPEYPLIPEPL